MKRTGLLFDPKGTARAALQSFDMPGWQFLHADSAPAAERILADTRCDIGLVAFTSAMLPEQAELERLLAGGGTEWIAIVPVHALRDAALCRFILRAFRDYHTLPLDQTRLAITIGHATGINRLKPNLAESHQETGRFGMIGCSPPMQQLYRQIEKVVSAEDPVLIGGASGTGKELVASAIHRHSRRASGPFVAVDCGAIPANLIQSELFGYEKGAFTGATQRKPGKIEAANGGVLFLDEIGNLPMDMQTNLLRFLQEKSIVRLGSNLALPVNVRVIAATHVDLAQAAAQGLFREDLYYRLNVLRLELLALKARGHDIALLADGIFARLSTGLPNLQLTGFSSEAISAMMSYEWPGNVRELINRIKRAMIMSENRLISAADLGLAGEREKVNSRTLEDARICVENQIVEACLRTNGNNVSRAARQLGVSRMTMYRLINKFNIALERPPRGPLHQRSC